MQKSIFQDMVKINGTKKLPTQKVMEKPERLDRKRVREEPEEVFRAPLPGPVGVRRGRHGLWIVATVAVIFFIFSLSYFFARAEVTIDPKIKSVTLNQNFSAELDAQGENLSFDLVAISGDVSKTVQATEEKEVVQNARGTVVLYNKFSTAPQKLDIDTRLEGSNGKIYKTTKAITIPGMSGATPGSVEVAVYGAEAGEAYNSDPLDFKILGFKGTPKYDKFDGRSKGDLVGGFKGLSHVVSAEDKTKALAELKESLRVKLLQKATDQIPEGFILLKDAISLDIEDAGDTGVVSATNALPVVLKGTLHGVLFDEKKLTTKIAEKAIDKYDGSDVYISNIKDLVFQ